MKYFFTMIALWCAMAASSQTITHTLVINTPANTGDTVTWSITNTATSDVIYTGIHTNPNQFILHILPIPYGQYIFEINTSNCESFSGGLHSFSGEDYISGTNGSIGCGQSANFICKPIPCTNSCPTDLNFDGITDVSDLLIFIAQYGNTCK